MTGPDLTRVVITLRGVVQGVGFRPFVHRLASDLALAGDVRNAGGEVVVAVEGTLASVERFTAEVETLAPPGAVILEKITDRAAPTGARGFQIEPSEAHSTTGFVGPDRATCDACLGEHDAPGDRRHGYAFIACPACGPRLTAVRSLPYERSRTTWAGFPPCETCTSEQSDPSDRRFHAENVSCPACGPRLRFVGASEDVVSEAALELAVRALLEGRVGAIKGLGGYQLACDATNDRAVHRLRTRKLRDAKPFALLVRDLEVARGLCEVGAEEARLLASAARPIVLLRRRAGRDAAVVSAVAVGSPEHGVMLPSTALHHALASRVGRPLVLTSGNTAGEPMATTETEARMKLGEIADFFLHHDRPIALRLDDSVVRVADGAPLVLRRARGLAPLPFVLPRPMRAPALAVGAELKGAFAFAVGTHVVLGHHLGDLDRVSVESEMVHAAAHYEALLAVRPALVLSDLHPDFTSTHFAAARAREGARVEAIQHHHAHFAGCLLESRHDAPALGVGVDGLGLGPDGARWGGEFLLGDARSSSRYAHLRYVRVPGGDRAAREGWRMAAAHLSDAGEPLDLVGTDVGAARLSTLLQAASRGVGAPWTSSVGRLFDAVACIAGIRAVSTFEAQAAMELEWAATHDEVEPYPFDLVVGAANVRAIDTRPLVRAVAADVRNGTSVGTISGRFHAALAAVVLAVARLARLEHRIDAVALSGGAFANVRLLESCARKLRTDGFTVCKHRDVPPNDGGIAFGQIAVAWAREA